MTNVKAAREEQERRDARRNERRARQGKPPVFSAPPAPPVCTVYRTGEEPERVPLVETAPIVFREKRSGRVVLAAGDMERYYKVGGVDKRMVRVATVIPDGETTWIETMSPSPKDYKVNGLSDRGRLRPVLPKRRTRKSKGGKKGAAGVIR